MTVAAEAAEAGFYEQAMATPGSLAMRPLNRSPWEGVYREAAGWIHPAAPVVDLGCGTGRFAVACAEAGHEGGYSGIDFAPHVIDEARAYIAAAAPGYQATLECDDLRGWRPPDQRLPETTYVCLEVLEHLGEDIELVARIPAGHRLVFSVPNYGSASHMRRFPQLSHIWDRYGPLLTFRRWTLSPVGVEGKAIHVVDAARRNDSWR